MNQEITVRLGTVFVVGRSGFGPEPGWELSGENWMITQGRLPEDWPHLARGACQLLREMHEFTPQQRACANACIVELIR